MSCIRWMCLLVVMATALPRLAGADTHTAAVMPLGKGAGGSEFDGLGRALADMMVTDLSQSSALQLVERMQLSLVLDELKLAKSGFLDPKSAQKLGRGLSAQLVITGSFTVIGERFTMDCRIVAVESGGILVSARSNGPLADFVAIEKDVVEKLLAALEVKLSPGARRQLLLATPTENLRALASFGRGVEAEEAGLKQEARRAFEEALRQDPDFAKASLALGELALATEKASVDDRKRRENARERALHAALAALTPETRRDKGFKDTRASMLDFTIRQELLARAGQHCTRYQELKHYLLRRDGEFEGWFVGLAPRYQESWRAGSDLMDDRARDLGLFGSDSHIYSRSGDLMFSASGDLRSGMSLLLSHNLQPEKFRGSLLAVLARCHSGRTQIAEFDALAKRARGWSWIDGPLFSIYGSGPSTLTPRDSLDLYWAYLRAQYQGVDARVRARTDAVLARHPEGDEYRSSVLDRIQGIVSAGEQHERRVAARMGRSEAQILVATQGALQADARRFRLDSTLCKDLLAPGKPGIERRFERFSELGLDAAKDRRDTAVDQLALELAPLFQAGCFSSRSKLPGAKALRERVRKGLGRVHPGQLEEPACLERRNQLRSRLAEPSPSNDRLHASLHTLLYSLQQLRHQRCLIP